MQTNEENVHALPAPQPAGAELVKVKFKQSGRKKKTENILAAPLPQIPELTSKKPTLQGIFMLNEKGQQVSTGLYEFPGQYGFYIRPYFKNRQRKKKLDVPLIKNRDAAIQKAIAVYQDFMEDLRLFKRGKIERDPFRDSEDKDLVTLCEFYETNCLAKKLAAAKALIRNTAPNSPAMKDLLSAQNQIEKEQRRLEMLKRWPRARYGWNEFTLEDCGTYHEWRTKKMSRLGRGGHRTTELDLVVLSKVFRYALMNESKTGVERNPFGEGRPRFVDSKTVSHCRDRMPRSADELHALANMLFQDTRSEVFGWVLLFQAMIGHRINELLRLRMDAKELPNGEGEPGCIAYPTDVKKRNADDPLTKKILFLFRKNSHKSAFGHIKIFPELAKVIEAHRLWHKSRYPNGNVWFFPSPRGDEETPVDDTSLTHALYLVSDLVNKPFCSERLVGLKSLKMARAALGSGKKLNEAVATTMQWVRKEFPKASIDEAQFKICVETGGDQRRTSHGLRAYRVNVLRSEGMPDEIIALHIGQKTHGKMIKDVYGEALPYKLGYMPETEDLAPAWEMWLPKRLRSGPTAKQQPLVNDDFGVSKKPGQGSGS